MSEDPTTTARSLEDVFASVGGQPNSCTHEEYYAFARRIREIAPCRLLVFGVGRDSNCWLAVNNGGTTLFLENNPEWIERIGTEIGGKQIRSLSYQQLYEEWEAAECSPEAVPLPQLENAPFDRSWDCIFVDAPWGPTFGRHQSTHAATRAVTPGGLIALHDCEREREQVVCRVLLEARGFELVEETERLRIYRAPSHPSPQVGAAE
ncbi:MAG: hypothetical protein VCA73_04080 [Roseibacillus sp.]|jgi:glucuronoxylan 4-O-methyltransferase